MEQEQQNNSKNSFSIQKKEENNFLNSEIPKENAKGDQYSILFKEQQNQQIPSVQNAISYKQSPFNFEDVQTYEVDDFQMEDTKKQNINEEKEQRIEQTIEKEEEKEIQEDYYIQKQGNNDDNESFSNHKHKQQSQMKEQQNLGVQRKIIQTVDQQTENLKGAINIEQPLQFLNNPLKTIELKSKQSGTEIIELQRKQNDNIFKNNDNNQNRSYDSKEINIKQINDINLSQSEKNLYYKNQSQQNKSFQILNTSPIKNIKEETIRKSSNKQFENVQLPFEKNIYTQTKDNKTLSLRDEDDEQRASQNQNIFNLPISSNDQQSNPHFEGSVLISSPGNIIQHQEGEITISQIPENNNGDDRQVVILDQNNENNEEGQVAVIQQDDDSFQLQQTQNYISTLRSRLDLRIQSIRSLSSIIGQKILFKKILLILYYFPLCVGFFVLLIRNAIEYCNLNLLIHLCIYTIFSLRNFILNIYLYKKCKQIYSVLHLYDNNVLSHDTFYCILSDLQAQYKKQLILQIKIEQKAREQQQQQNNQRIIQNNQIDNNVQPNALQNHQHIFQQPIPSAQLQIQTEQNFFMILNALQNVNLNEGQNQIQSPQQINNQNNYDNNNNMNGNNVNIMNQNIDQNNNVNQIENPLFANNNSLQQNMIGRVDEKRQEEIANNFYLIQVFSLIINTLHDSNTLKQLLLNAPNIRESKNGYNVYQLSLFSNLRLTPSLLKETDFLIQHNQQMVYHVNSTLIQREIETLMKYRNKFLLAKIMRVYSFLEEYYLVIYNLLEFTFNYCYSSEINSIIVFSFYYSVVNWIQIVIITFTLIFMLLALIFYFFFQILVCKRKKSIKTVQFKDAKSYLISTKKFTEKEIEEINCIICYEDFVDKDQIYLSDCCKRCYHKQCITEWFKKSLKCPLCRTEIVP